MAIGWRLFLWAVILPILPIMYFTLKNECKPKKNIIVGVALPYEARNDVSVLAFLERYKKELKLTCWGFLAIIVPCLFIQSFSVSMTVWLTWIVLVCVVFSSHTSVAIRICGSSKRNGVGGRKRLLKWSPT